MIINKKRLAGAVLAFAAGTGLLAGNVQPTAAAPLEVSTLYDSTCPYLIQAGQTGGGCITHLQSELNSKENAGLEVSGTFDDATGAAVEKWQTDHSLEADGVVGPKTKESLGDKQPTVSGVGGQISRDEVIARSENWITAVVMYSQSDFYPDPQGKTYRQDCSGFVSMAWHLDQSLTTATLPSVATKIDKADLQPGDILDEPSHHTVLFLRWADDAHTQFVLRQESQTGEPAQEKTASLSGYYDSFDAYRYNNITD